MNLHNISQPNTRAGYNKNKYTPNGYHKEQE